MTNLATRPSLRQRWIVRSALAFDKKWNVQTDERFSPEPLSEYDRLQNPVHVPNPNRQDNSGRPTLSCAAER
jgi:hypothetical protein